MSDCPEENMNKGTIYFPICGSDIKKLYNDKDVYITVTWEKLKTEIDWHLYINGEKKDFPDRSGRFFGISDSVKTSTSIKAEYLSHLGMLIAFEYFLKKDSISYPTKIHEALKQRDANFFFFRKIDFFIRTELSIIEALQNLIDIYNKFPKYYRKPSLDYYLSFNEADEYYVIKSKSGDMLAVAFKNRNIICLGSVNPIIGDIILLILLDLFGWDNVKCVSTSERDFQAITK